MSHSHFIDLSHTIFDGLVTYKGLPAPVICDYLSREQSRALYAPGTEFQIGKIELIANTGTYLDTPFHRFAGGKDLSQIAPEQFTDLPALVVRVPHRAQLTVDASFFRNLDVRGKAVLVHTGWDEFWNTPVYFTAHPYLTSDAAEWLRDAGAVLVGIDSHNIDNTAGNTRPVHSTLLGADVLIVEHLTNLAALPDSGFTFSAIPPKFRGVGTFPVRALARLP